MKKMVLAGMIIVGLVLVHGIKVSNAGSQGIIQVSATVLPNLSQTMMSQKKALDITNLDISKGYIDIKSGTVLQVKSNDPNGYLLIFNVDGLSIGRVEARINGRTVSVQSGIGSIHKACPGKAGETVVITYRLMLSPKTLPGTYEWPVTVIASLI